MLGLFNGFTVYIFPAADYDYVYVIPAVSLWCLGAGGQVGVRPLQQVGQGHWYESYTSSLHLRTSLYGGKHGHKPRGGGGVTWFQLCPDVCVQK